MLLITYGAVIIVVGSSSCIESEELSRRYEDDYDSIGRQEK